MEKYRMISTDFWVKPIGSKGMTLEDKYFYFYLLTNPYTTQDGIYQMPMMQMAFDLGYSIESVQMIIKRFTLHHKLVEYNPETRELVIKNWGEFNHHIDGQPVKDDSHSDSNERNLNAGEE